MRRDGTEGFWVYIMASQRNGMLYIGHSEHLGRRVFEHANGLIGGFTKDYGCKTLVWAEWHESREAAFSRERAMKQWRRAWKIRLIEEFNPTWRDMLAYYLA